MYKKQIIIVSAFIITLFSVTLFAEGTIGIIVNKDLYSSVEDAIQTYINDLEKIADKDVWLNVETFDDNGSVAALKDSLKEHWENDNLEGAVFVGDLPIAQFKNPSDYGGGPSTFACDLFYMDLDGEWSPTSLPTSHEDGSGDIDADIWVSRLTTSVLTSYSSDNESEIINKYFARVRIRMCGQDDQASELLVVGQSQHWGGLEGEHTDGKLGYGSSETTTGTSASVWENGLSEGKEYGYIYSHSGPTMHEIGYNIRDHYSNNSDCRFYNSYACSNGKYTTANMVGAYATDGEGLICAGTTKTGSMQPGSYEPYNASLGDSSYCFGKAFKIWFNEAGIRNGWDEISWHYGMNLQGVGNLYLKPYDPVSIDHNKQTSLLPYSFKIMNSRINYTIPAIDGNKKLNVAINLYTMKGSLIKTLVNDYKSSGNYFIEIKDVKKQIAEGVYLIRMEIGDYKTAIKLVNK